MQSRPDLATLGHGRLGPDELAALLRDAGVGLVVDTRRFPGSRANEAAAGGRIPQILARVEIEYVWAQPLGGRRRLSQAEDAASPDIWWQVPEFRANAACTRTRTPEFGSGLAELGDFMADGVATAIMCSEAVWWPCHRRLVSDALVLEGSRDVRHLMHNGTLAPHPTAAGECLGGDGRVVWDAIADRTSVR